MEPFAQELRKAESLIRKILWLATESLKIEVDLNKVDFINSAVLALDEEKLYEGPEDEFKKAIRFLLCTVYLDGTKVIDESIMEMISNLNRCAFDEFTLASVQVKHSDLMVVSISQISKKMVLLIYEKCKPRGLIIVEEVKEDGTIIYRKTNDPFKILKTLYLSEYGVVSYPSGKWNASNWLELVLLKDEDD